MAVDWKFKQCILCLGEGELCEEHLIPRSLGGILTCRFLCRSCNSKLGYDVDASAASDPLIVWAVQHLREDIPELAQQIIEKIPHVTIGDGPRVSGYIRNHEFKVKCQTLEDGTLILPADQTCHAIAKMLKRDGYRDTQIQDSLETLQELEESQQTAIAPGLDVINWPVQEIKPDLSQCAPLDPLLPTKIAFEFLALCAGNAIYANEQQLSDLRRIIMRDKGLDDMILRVERLSSGKYQSFHGIVIEDNPKYFQLQIRLFGLLAYRVHFLKLHLDGPRFSYTHCLRTGEEETSEIGAKSKFSNRNPSVS